ncbi:hypothetical protein H2200_007840 [Cladophialophora chaetospira]|uniref:Leptomycin B resistance protein pmd1 n=1 Tax=Cladophialophora chaetospira TaxID=386627 RepID=A0AA38X6I2_9EURO|nr:hypothetical protein H2200_007840 [Cladophialophora chaetospira]
MEYYHSYDHEEEPEYQEDDFSYDFSYLAIAGPRQSRTIVERKKSNALERKKSLARQKSKRERKQRPVPQTITEDAGEQTNLDVGEDEAPELAHLPENERRILAEQTQVPDKIVKYTQLYRYATRRERLIIVISCLCCIAGGAALPLMNVVFGRVAGQFQQFFQGTITKDKFLANLSHNTLYFVYLAAGEFVTIYIGTAGFLYIGNAITNTIRIQYLKALFRQNIAFFDSLGSGEITTRITTDTNLIQDAISEKASQALTAFSTFITVFVVGFFFFWKLTLICASVIVAIVLTMGGGSVFLGKFNQQSLAMYAIGNSVAEEVFSSIRVCVAFSLQRKLGDDYAKQLKKAFIFGYKAKTLQGFLIGSVFCFTYLSYGLAFWMGSRFLVSGETTLANILTIIMSIIIGSMTLGMVALNTQSFGSGVAAAAQIYNTIDRNSPLDYSSTDGLRLDHFEGTVTLDHIKHIYPSRPDVVVSEDLSIRCPAGTTTALVGPSGSGKSTIIGLLLRFYNPVRGNVYLDGHDIKDLNLNWLRQNIALVQQEPVLFAGTILENISYGLVGSPFEFEDAKTQEQRVINAAKMANAHDFIMQLPENYYTHIGERGLLLSGGQKQRIAIARAVIKDPKILLLDEATSALDSQSEAVVQQALDNASRGRTTIVIAHRLSTIRHADNILVMRAGSIVEQGNHEQLLDLMGVYASLVKAQSLGDTGSHDVERSPDSPMLSEDDDYCTCDHDHDDDYSDTLAGGSNVHLPLQPHGEKMTRSMSRAAKRAEEAIPETAQKKYSIWTSMKYVASFNKKEKLWMILGITIGAIPGLAQPIQGVLFSKAIDALSQPLREKAEIRSDTNFYCLLYIGLGFLQLFTLFFSNWALAWCSENLISRARDIAFRTMLAQDISFFDEKENGTGSLISFLSTQTSDLAGLSGATFVTILSAVVTLIASVAVSLAIGWKLALVCISTIPVLVGCGFFRFQLLSSFQIKAQKSYAASAGYACENVNAIRTIASLTTEKNIVQRYADQLNAHAKRGLKSNLRSTTLFAATDSAQFLCLALGFWYGGQLVANREYSLFQFFVCFSEVIFGAQAAGQVFSFAGDMSKSKTAADKLKTLTDRKVKIDSLNPTGRKLRANNGLVEFNNVYFRYPTRQTVPVLEGMNITIKPGQFAALVGGSGCGKSTMIQLMERFYDVDSGSVTIDGQDISKLNVQDYRSYIGLVSQEPALYAGSLRDNIMAGVDGRTVTEEDLVRACKEANIYDFIISLPEGFDTKVGNKAVMLSGGQKQRIAIARALIRNPKILLLDEATSALDSESEKVVQAALEVAAQDRTTIAVVHRLSSIKNADIIFVLDKGSVLEAGNHEELMARNGRYRQMVIAQSLE